MTDQLFPIEAAATDVELIGFDGASVVEPAPPEADAAKSALPVKTKPRRRADKLEKRIAVRVWFDGRELAKLNGRAAAQGMALPEYLRRRALRDPRVRNARTETSGGDL